jgi:DNA-binding MarR family transcriptional regulator
MSRQTREVVLQELLTSAREAQNASDAVDEAVGQLLGLNRTDMHCVDILEREGRLTAGELARASGLTTGAVTAVLDRLERAGYAKRVRDPGDRRRVLVEATEKAHRVGEELYGDVGRAAASALRRYSLDELVLIRDFLRLDRDLNEAHLARLKERALPDRQ